MKKKALSILLALAMCLSLLPATALAANDLSGHWAEDVITQWQEKGYVSGYADGSFRPNAPVTRAAFAKLMNRAVGFTEEAAISFADVAAGDWYYHEVARAVSAGYTQGYADGTFRPNKDITRAEAAAMIARATGLTAQERYADGFSDEIPAWARGSVGAVAAAGFMTGYADGTFHANATITRAAAVVTLDRVAKKAQETVTITEPGTTLENQLIAGDLIVAESVGEGNVYLKNVTVLGETYIRGGGSHSFYAENSRFGGTVYMQKDRLHMGLSGTTQIGNMQMEKPSNITFEKGFSGSVKDLTIPEGAPEGKYSIEAEDKDSTPVENVNLDAKADLSLGANVSKMTIGEKAEDSSITVEKDTTVDSMEVNSKVEVDGKGTVDSMDVSASGVTTDKDLTVKDTTTSNGAAAPTTPATKPASSSSGSSSGGGYTRPTVTITPTIINLWTTREAIFDLNAAVTADDLKISVVKGGTVLEKDTDYTLTLSTGPSGTTIHIDFNALAIDTTYQVTIEASSVGAGKYSITKTTTTLLTPKSLQWSATASGTESIVPGTEIPTGSAKVTFTVTGATFNNGSGTFGAKLQGSSSASAAIDINSSKITASGNTVTVSLDGKNLSADTYTVTLFVDIARLELSAPYVADELSTATTTFEVTKKPAALGDFSPSEAIEFTSGQAIPADCNISFPATGIASLATSGDNAATATISPPTSDIEVAILTESNAVVVKLTGTPTDTEDKEYTVTLNIPKDSITLKDGYTRPAADLEKTFTFKVTTTTPVTAEGNGGSVTLDAGAEIPENTTISVIVTGASALTTSGIQVLAFQSGYSVEINSSAAFTAPTESNTGTLVLTLSGTAPTPKDGELANYSNGLKVVIPSDNITAMAGYTVPTDDITVSDFKFVLNPAPESGA